MVKGGVTGVNPKAKKNIWSICYRGGFFKGMKGRHSVDIN